MFSFLSSKGVSLSREVDGLDPNMSLGLRRTLKVQAEGKTDFNLTLAINLSSDHDPVSSGVSFHPSQPPAPPCGRALDPVSGTSTHTPYDFPCLAELTKMARPTCALSHVLFLRCDVTLLCQEVGSAVLS